MEQYTHLYFFKIHEIITVLVSLCYKSVIGHQYLARMCIRSPSVIKFTSARAPHIFARDWKIIDDAPGEKHKQPGVHTLISQQTLVLFTLKISSFSTKTLLY